jgi:hypothetical protein
MKHLLRSVIALGSFAVLAAANGCSAQAGSEDGQPQDVSGASLGEAQEAVVPNTVPAAELCTVGPSLIQRLMSTPTVGENVEFVECGIGVVVDRLDDDFCLTGAWDQQCVSEALSFCPPAGIPVTCSCSHSVCDTGNPLDSGCPGRASFLPQCPALVCEQLPSCCSSGWGPLCVNEAERLCNPSCGGDPTAEGGDNNK